MDINSTTTHPPSSCLVDRSGSVAAIKTVIVTASTLSILGALIIIIVSYCKGETRKRNDTLSESTVLQSPTALQTNAVETQADVRKDESRKEKVRHPARLIIACISAADIIVAISHIWGVTNNYVPLEHASSHYTGAAENAECGAQAVLSIFGAISSFCGLICLHLWLW